MANVPIGNLLGGAGWQRDMWRAAYVGLEGQRVSDFALRQALCQQNAYGASTIAGVSGTPGTTAGASGTITIWPNTVASTAPPARKKVSRGDESAAEWLDRRVAEMRVKL